MSNTDMDVDMTSPPPSPRPSPTSPDDPHPLPYTRSDAIPIAANPAPRAPSRFQPPIAKTATPAFAPVGPHAPTAAYSHGMFKLKSPRVPSVPTNQPHPSLHQHTRPLQSASRFTPMPNPHASLKNAPASPTLPPSSLADRDAAPVGTVDHADPAAIGAPMKRTAPLQIPQSTSVKASASSPDARPPTGRSVGTPTTNPVNLSLSTSLTIPTSLPNISPSYPATLFGGLSADDEHVTVWEPQTGKTVAGNAAPYRRNLPTWLKGHPGWEEKADELKSSKRRSAARRSRNAADAFAALCCYPVATFLANDAAKHLQGLGDGDHCNEEAMMMWTSDDFVRLQEALYRLGQDCHAHACNSANLDEARWAQVSSQIGGSKMQGTVVYCAHHMLTRGIAKSQRELAGSSALPASFGAVTIAVPDSSGIGSPASVSSYDNAIANGFESFGGPSSMPALQGGLGASFLERSFRAPREPRVTVWNPLNGRTISGNAAPCRRNLEAWMRQHPGWCPKEEGQLSSSRRNRNRKIRPSSMPAAPGVGPSSVEPESPHFHDALEGLLHLSRSPSATSPPNRRTVDAQLEAQVARAEGEPASPTSSQMDNLPEEGSGGSEAKKLGMTSSVSSSSAEDGTGVISDGDEIEAGSKMEL